MDAGTVWLAVGAMATVTSTAVAGGLAVRDLRRQSKTIQAQNDEQLRKQAQFQRDWDGEPARPGVPERPGVLERIRRIEGQFRPNGGDSVKDALTRIEREQISQRTKLDDHVNSHEQPGEAGRK